MNAGGLQGEGKVEEVALAVSAAAESSAASVVAKLALFLGL